MTEPNAVRHVARLARLDLDEAELDAQTEQMGRILAFFDAMNAVDTSGVPLTAHPFPVVNALREDVVAPSLSREDLLSGSPQREGDMFRVPKILDA